MQNILSKVMKLRVQRNYFNCPQVTQITWLEVSNGIEFKNAHLHYATQIGILPIIYPI